MRNFYAKDVFKKEDDMRNSKISISLICLVFGISMYFAAGAFADVQCVGQYEIDDHTIGLWHMNEGEGTLAVNATGDDYYDGYIEGNPLATWATGRFGNGIHLGYNGDNGINLGPLSESGANYTLEINFKWDYAYVGELGYLFSIPEEAFARAYLVDHGASPATYQFQYSVRKGDGEWVIVTTPADNVLDNQWHHLAFTREWDGTNTAFKVYVDGVLKATGGYPIGFFAPGYKSNVYIGSAGALNSMGGVIDEVRYSNIVRTNFQNDWGYQKGDVNKDCYVNFEDLAQMASGWLDCTNPNDPICTAM
jgi:hypothetical protein